MVTEIWRLRETGTSRGLRRDRDTETWESTGETHRSVGSETGTKEYRHPDSRDRPGETDTQTAPSTGDSGGGGAYRGAFRAVASGFLRGVVQGGVWRGVSRRGNDGRGMDGRGLDEACPDHPRLLREGRRQEPLEEMEVGKGAPLPQ